MNVALIFTVLLFGTAIDHSNDQPLPTKLRITVLDGRGNTLEEASVAIYENVEDYFASVNAAAVGTTDEKGQVLFKDLKPISYFVDAKRGNENNKGEGIVTGALLEGRINKVNTIIEE